MLLKAIVEESRSHGDFHAADEIYGLNDDDFFEENDDNNEDDEITGAQENQE